jgi:hypothetical protein
VERSPAFFSKFRILVQGRSSNSKSGHDDYGMIRAMLVDSGENAVSVAGDPSRCWAIRIHIKEYNRKPADQDPEFSRLLQATTGSD